jgi:purine-binding chemotaxis protein CheW
MKPKDKMLYSTFRISGRLYGIDVTRVQEVTKSLPCTRVPLTPKHVKGLINLRGQIATAIELRELFDLKASEEFFRRNA